MRKFYFRLQRVLEYRELQEGWAKESYVHAKTARLKAERTLAALIRRKERTQAPESPTLEYLQNLETYLAKLGDEIEAQRSVVAILKADEEKAHGEWLEARKKRKALAKLREAAETHWRKEIESEEQKRLDDWTSSRRAG